MATARMLLHLCSQLHKDTWSNGIATGHQNAFVCILLLEEMKNDLAPPGEHDLVFSPAFGPLLTRT